MSRDLSRATIALPQSRQVVGVGRRGFLVGTCGVAPAISAKDRAARFDPSSTTPAWITPLAGAVYSPSKVSPALSACVAHILVSGQCAHISRAASTRAWSACSGLVKIGCPVHGGRTPVSLLSVAQQCNTVQHSGRVVPYSNVAATHSSTAPLRHKYRFTFPSSVNSVPGKCPSCAHR